MAHDHVRCRECRGTNKWGAKGRQVLVNCAECATSFFRQKSLVEGKIRSFCNRVCQRKWFAANVPRGSEHPQWAGGPSEKDRRASPTSRLRRRISNQIWWALKGLKKNRKWESLVGFNVEQLKTHLEKQFLPGMSWKNYGDWHIDHRRPVASFSFVTAEDDQFKECFSLTNLQPLWAADNLRKGAALVYIV